MKLNRNIIIGITSFVVVLVGLIIGFTVFGEKSEQTDFEKIISSHESIKSSSFEAHMDISIDDGVKQDFKINMTGQYDEFNNAAIDLEVIVMGIGIEGSMYVETLEDKATLYADFPMLGMFKLPIDFTELNNEPITEVNFYYDEDKLLKKMKELDSINDEKLGKLKGYELNITLNEMLDVLPEALSSSIKDNPDFSSADATIKMTIRYDKNYHIRIVTGDIVLSEEGLNADISLEYKFNDINKVKKITVPEDIKNNAVDLNTEEFGF